MNYSNQAKMSTAIGIPRRNNRPRIRATATLKPARKMTMKLSIKQRLRNWLINDDDELYATDSVSEANHLESEGMRFNLFKASGGFVIETRTYDSRNDRNINKMYVIHEGDDVGEQLGKIITMESLR